jgi:hypothetical protein
MKSVKNIPLRAYVGLVTLADSANTRLDRWSEGSSKHAKAELAGGFVGGALALGAGTAFAGEVAGGGASASGGGCSGSSTSTLVSLIETAGGFLAAIVAAVSVAMLLYASLLYITSGGNYGRAGKAKETAKNVVIGFGLAACIFLLRSIILQIVGGAGGEGSSGNSVSSCLGKTGNSIH